MKLRVLGIGAVVVLLLTMVAGAIGTGAWFTEQDVLGPNALAAGTVNPEVRGVTVLLTNAEPGKWYGPYFVDFVNTPPNSTLPVKYRITSRMSYQSVSGFFGKINVVAELNEGNNWVRYYNGPLDRLMLDPSVCRAMANVPVGSAHQWRLGFQIDRSTGDQYQGAQVTFDLLFDSTQAINPGWEE
ncbi:MAG TPA: hypothetical protein GX702_02985 [Chloroflexi bacterium]|nr:hypothetical protein [Chloroflexota bacterium]